MTWYLLHWQEDETFLGTNILEAEDEIDAQIKAQQANIVPGSNHWEPGPGVATYCPTSKDAQHSWVRDEQAEMLVCTGCDLEATGARQYVGTATILELPPKRPVPGSDREITWATVANRLLTEQQLRQLQLIAD